MIGKSVIVTAILFNLFSPEFVRKKNRMKEINWKKKLANFTGNIVFVGFGSIAKACSPVIFATPPGNTGSNQGCRS